MPPSSPTAATCDDPTFLLSQKGRRLSVVSVFYYVHVFLSRFNPSSSNTIIHPSNQFTKASSSIPLLSLFFLFTTESMFELFHSHFLGF